MFFARRLWWCGLGLVLALVAGMAPDLTGGGPPTTLSLVNGIDVSNYQGTVDWTMVAGAGYRFAFAKATEGLTYQDPTFPANWANIKAAGMVRGAYHFGHPGEDAVSQADFFLNYMQPVKGDIWPVLDLETTDGQTPAQVWTWTQAFIQEIKTRTGHPGIIYTGFYFWRDMVGNPTNNLGCPLWIASYGVSQPQIPPAWPQYKFWQYSDQGSVPGVNGNCDLDYYNDPKAPPLSNFILR